MPIASKRRPPNAPAGRRDRPGAAPGAAPDAGPAARPATSRPSLSTVTLILFLAGLACRLVVFTGVHREGDEIVYRVLVQQLEHGLGYTLLGSPLNGHDWPADQYGQALFFHPPGGIALFLILDRLMGERSLPVAQVLSYALFFFSMMALGRTVLAPLRGLPLHAVAALAAFTPIMTHVLSRYWLDGPMLAFSTLAAALLASALERGSTRQALLAGLVMGYASWIKSAALIMVPGLLLLAWAMARPGQGRATLRLVLLFAGVALAVQMPWELWQWSVVGSPFPAWAGKPSPELVANNPYVQSITVDRPSWMYFTLTPRVVWTLVPSLACLAAPRFGARARRIALALIGWIVVVLAAVAALGAIGYSKLLRYAILVTPATVLLFGITAREVWTRLADPRLTPPERTRIRALAGFTAVGLALEVAQGIYTPFQAGKDTIAPILMPSAWFY